MAEHTPIHPIAYLLRSFAVWYARDFSRRIVRTGRDALRVVATVVPFTFLLKTLASPWKQIRDETPTRGIALEKRAEALTLALTARGIGLLLRTAVLVLGVVLAAAALALTAAALLAWVALPPFIAGFLVVAAIVL